MGILLVIRREDVVFEFGINNTWKRQHIGYVVRQCLKWRKAFMKDKKLENGWKVRIKL